MSVQGNKWKLNPEWIKATKENSGTYMFTDPNPYKEIKVGTAPKKTSFERSLEGEQVWPPRTLNVRNFVKLPVTGEVEMFEVPVNPSPALFNETEKST